MRKIAPLALIALVGCAAYRTGNSPTALILTYDVVNKRATLESPKDITIKHLDITIDGVGRIALDGYSSNANVQALTIEAERDIQRAEVIGKAISEGVAGAVGAAVKAAVPGP